MKGYFLYRDQSLKEEVVNAISHGVGLLFFLISIPILFVQVARYINGKGIAALAMFSFGLVAVYLFSTLYHSFQNPRIKKVLRTFDHISIYMLIGGSYTALVWKYIQSDTATIFLSVMWSIIGVAAILKLFFTHRFRLLSTLLYIALGWMAVFIIKPLWHNLPSNVWLLIILGGGSYMLGTIFYMMKNIRFTHFVWHLFVLGGSVFHFFAVYKSYMVV